MRRLPFVMVAGLVAALSGCAASNQYFRPTERAQGETWRGFPQAAYPVTLGGKQVGEMKVWSPGAAQTKEHGTSVEVGFELANSGQSALSLDPNELKLDVITKNGELNGVQLTRFEGGTSVDPGSVSDMRAAFDLGDISPGDIQAFRVQWRVNGEGQSFVRSTPFAEQPSSYGNAYAPYWWSPWYPYYWGYPYYGPSLGFGLGLGFYDGVYWGHPYHYGYRHRYPYYYPHEPGRHH